jgi:hypothetical protein
MVAVGVCRTAVLTGANVADKEKMSTECQGAVELGEHSRQQLRRRVVDGVVGKDAAQRVVFDLQGGHGAHGETQVRVGASSQFDHPRRHVDADRRHPESGQV